jgi:flagellar protein FlgJ
MDPIVTGEAGFYQDLSRLKSVRGADGLAAAAKGFETLFLQLVLKNMRAGADALADPDSPLASPEQRLYRDLYDGQLAGALAARGDTGIAAAIVQQLGGELKSSAPAVALPLQETPTAQPSAGRDGHAAFQQPLWAPGRTRDH